MKSPTSPLTTPAPPPKVWSPLLLPLHHAHTANDPAVLDLLRAYSLSVDDAEFRALAALPDEAARRRRCEGLVKAQEAGLGLEGEGFVDVALDGEDDEKDGQGWRREEGGRVRCGGKVLWNPFVKARTVPVGEKEEKGGMREKEEEEEEKRQRWAMEMGTLGRVEMGMAAAPAATPADGSSARLRKRSRRAWLIALVAVAAVLFLAIVIPLCCWQAGLDCADQRRWFECLPDGTSGGDSGETAAPNATAAATGGAVVAEITGTRLSTPLLLPTPQ